MCKNINIWVPLSVPISDKIGTDNLQQKFALSMSNNCPKIL